MTSRLRRCDPAAPGIRRIRRGRGFSYVGPDGRPASADDVARARALAIPPAWTDVWICTDPAGHIQSTGRDAAGRLQYRYHPLWQQRRDGIKHERVRALARRLPSARERVARDLARRTLDRRRVLAAAFRMLDLGSFRIGSECYADSNGTFGLATLRRDHVEVEGERITFRYTAKGAQDVTVRLRDRSLARTIRALLERDDDHPDLLAFRDGQGWHDVRSSDVNEYVREACGMPVSAKDLRTWNATARMALALAAHMPPPTTQRDRTRIVNACLAEVSAHLGNTPAVARRSYVDARVIDLWNSGTSLARVRRASPATVDRRLADLLADD